MKHTTAAAKTDHGEIIRVVGAVLCLAGTLLHLLGGSHSSYSRFENSLVFVGFLMVVVGKFYRGRGDSESGRAGMRRFLRFLPLIYGASFLALMLRLSQDAL